MTIEMTEDTLTFKPSEGRTISVSISWYPRLVRTTPKEHNNSKMIGIGQGIHRSDIGKDLSIEGFLSGRRSDERQQSFKSWLEAK